MFIYNIKPNKTKISRYDYHRIVESMFSKSVYHIEEDGEIVVLTEESEPKVAYDGSVVIAKTCVDTSKFANSTVFCFSIDVYAQCLIDNKYRSVPKDKVTDWMIEKLKNAGFEVMNIETRFLGYKNEKITKNKSCPTPVNRFCGYIRITDEQKVASSILNGFGKRKHLGLGLLRLM